MTEIRQEVLRLIALNNAEQWVPEHIAFQKLLNRHGDRLIPGLIECLGDEDAEVRQLTVELLSEGRPRSDVAIPDLIERLTDDDRLVRNSTVWALMEFGEAARPAIPALKRLLDDHTEPYIRLGVAGAISRIAPEDSAALPVLIEGLRNPLGIHRATACELLGERRNKTGVLKAMALLSDPEFSVRFAAGVAVGKTFNYWFHAVAVCIAMLKDADWITRRAGKECLLSLGAHAKADMDLLKMAIVDAEWDVRIDLEEALDELRKRKT
jgi:HEAT repeat protein